MGKAAVKALELISLTIKSLILTVLGLLTFSVNDVKSSPIHSMNFAQTKNGTERQQ